jgi:ABC-2 type transport system permease protein
MSLAYAMSDSATMLRRSIKHSFRNPNALFGTIAFPSIMLLLFVYVFGGAYAVGGTYLNYIEAYSRRMR